MPRASPGRERNAGGGPPWQTPPGLRPPRARGRLRSRPLPGRTPAAASGRAARGHRSSVVRRWKQAGFLRLEILAHQAVDHTVDPFVVAPVRLAAHAFAKEARTLGMLLRALVETVDLELETVEAEVEEQVALEELRRFVRQPAAAEVGVHRERAEVRNPAAAVPEPESHQTGAPGVAPGHERAGS